MSKVSLPPAGPRILVVGYGNELRRDDGVGPHVAAAASAWRTPGLWAIGVPQLAPELAEPLGSAGIAFFVDARLGERIDMVAIVPLEPARSRATLAHASEPRALLALAQAIYGRHPRSWLLTVPVADFSLGIGLSPRGRRGAQEALDQLAALIECAAAESTSGVAL